MLAILRQGTSGGLSQTGQVRNVASRWFERWTRDPELSHLGGEGRRLQSKVRRGTTGSANHATGLPQRFENQLALRGAVLAGDESRPAGTTRRGRLEIG